MSPQVTFLRNYLLFQTLLIIYLFLLFSLCSKLLIAIYPTRACLRITMNKKIATTVTIPIETNRNYVDILLICPEKVTISIS